MAIFRKTDECSTNNESIRKYLGFNIKILSFIGLELNVNNDRIIQKSRFLQKLPIFATNMLGFIAVFFQVSYICDALPRDSHLAAQICCEIISNVLCICKSFRVANAVEDLQMMFNEIAIVWEKYRPGQDYRNEILSRAKNTLSFCRFYLGIMLSAMAGFGLPPLHNILFQYLARETTNHTYDYSKRVFFFMYPFEVNSASIYFSVLFEEEYLLILSGIYWVCCDTLFAQVVIHISLQFKILQNDIETWINSENMENRLKENIFILIKRHQGLLRICKLIEHVFSPVIFATMLLTALNICVNLFEVKGMSSKGYYGKTAFYATLVVILFFSIIFYCIFAEILTEQTSSIANAVYNCKWTIKNHKLRFYLQMIIMKSQIPFYCTAYGFFPIGHKQFASIISTSFSYYMMLQTMS